MTDLPTSPAERRLDGWYYTGTAVVAYTYVRGWGPGTLG